MTGSNSDTSDDRMTRVSARVTDPMLAAIDRLVEAGEYSSRGECIRAGIRREFRDAGVERGNRRPRSGETLIGDGGQYYSGAGDGQCVAIKDGDGERCTNGVYGSTQFCGTHKNASGVTVAPVQDGRDWFRCPECGWQPAEYEQGGGSPPYCSWCGIEFPTDAAKWPPGGSGGPEPVTDGGWDPAQGDPATEDGPDHDVPVEEQLTERQRELVGRDGGDE